MSRITARCRLLLPALALAVSASDLSAAQNALEAELQVIDDRSAVNQAVLKEIQRQADERVVELQNRIAYWVGIKALCQERAAALQRDFDERIKKGEKALATLQSITVKSDEERNLPTFGWFSVVSLTSFLNGLREEYAKVKQLIAAGRAEWHYASLGWLSGEQIDAKIKALEDEVRAIQKGVADGTYEIHSPVMGWVAGARCRARIAELERERQALRDRVAKGEYQVQIPGLGIHSRNSLNAEIRRAETTMADIKARAAKGELAVHRPALGWCNRKELQARMAEGQKAFDVMKALVADGLFDVWIEAHGVGWTKLADLKRRLAEADKGLADDQKAIGEGVYVAQTPVGWISQKDLEAQLDSAGKEPAKPELGKEAREALVKRIEALRKSLADWQALSAFDIAIKGMERARINGWMVLPLKLARPEFEHRQLNRNEQAAHHGDFERELRDALMPHEAELRRLNAARAWIPG